MGWVMATEPVPYSLEIAMPEVTGGSRLGVHKQRAPGQKTGEDGGGRPGPHPAREGGGEGEGEGSILLGC